MQRKTKYDILEQELKQSSKNILSLVFSVLSLSRKLNSNKVSDEEKARIEEYYTENPEIEIETKGSSYVKR